MFNAGGGGYGSPAARPPALVADDLRNRMISGETAHRFHDFSGAGLPPAAAHRN